MDIKSKFNLEEPANGKKLKLNTIYFIAFKELIPNKATSISTILANKVFNYLLTLENMIKSTLTTDPFIYTLNTPKIGRAHV